MKTDGLTEGEVTEDMGILRRFRLITLTKVIFNIYLSFGPKLYAKVYLVNQGGQAWDACCLIPFVWGSGGGTQDT